MPDQMQTSAVTSPRSRAIQDAESRRRAYTVLIAQLAGAERDLHDALDDLPLAVLNGRVGQIAHALVALAQIRQQMPALMPAGME